MRTFLFSDEKSHKFWNIELKGASFTVTFGRVGTAGQTQLKTFASEAQARKEHDKLIAEKTRKGYVETTPGAGKPAAPAPSSLRESLEHALAEEPDELAHHMAYADYLAEQGDPRGELIRVQLALEDESRPAAERKKLRQQEKALLGKHAKAWLGELASYQELYGEDTIELRAGENFLFQRGWLDRLGLNELTVSHARALAKSPQLRLLRSLTIGRIEWCEAGDFTPQEEREAGHRPTALDLLAASSHLGNVRQLHIGHVSDEDDYERWEGSSGGTGPGVARLVARMPRLEELRVWARGVDLDKLFALPLRELRVMQVYHMNRQHPLEKLAKNTTLGKLTHLQFHPHHHEDYYEQDDFDPEEAYITRKGLQAVVRSANLASLTHLQLRLCSAGDDGVRDVITSGILKRLKVLDLRHGCVTDEGARLLAACPDARRLERLDLSYNALREEDPDLLEPLEKAGVDVRYDQQHIDPLEYLREGDFE